MRSRIPEKLSALEITTNIGCKVNCKHCPQSVLIKKYVSDRTIMQTNMMSMDLFKSCISKVVTNGTISFCGMSEPFLNPECAEMIRYAYEQGYKIMLFTTLVGMTLSDLRMIQDIKFQNVCLHIPDESQNAKIDITDQYKEILGEFIRKIKINSYSCHGEIHNSIKAYIGGNARLQTKLQGRAGNLKNERVETYNHKGKIICTCGTDTHSGATPVLLPNGEVVICGNDYGMKHILGNLYKQNWNDIASGNAMKEVLYGFDDEDKDILCRHCHNARLVETMPENEFIVGPMNAIYIANLLQDSENIVSSLVSRKLISKIRQAKNICIFGYGKLFHDNYYSSAWNYVIGANYITDNAVQKIDPNNVADMKIIPPDKLKDIEDLLIIIYVKEDKEIQEQLREMGLMNYINIYDVYKIS